MNCRQVILLTAVVMVACADNPPAPIEDRSGGRSSTSTSARHARTGQNESAAIVGQPYTVRTGDTLTSIAFALGMHFKTLADINDISAPYAIYVGQDAADSGYHPILAKGCQPACRSRNRTVQTPQSLRWPKVIRSTPCQRP